MLATADIPLATAINMIRDSIDIIVFILDSDCEVVVLLIRLSSCRTVDSPEGTGVNEDSHRTRSGTSENRTDEERDAHKQAL